MIDAELLQILACPWCVSRPEPPREGIRKGELELQGPLEKPTGLLCKQCTRLYRIEDGIPNLLVDECVLPGKQAP